jgi:hypothetical protein
MIEKKGSQYRVRILNPKLFNKKTLRTKDVGRKGGLQLITGRLKGKKTTTIQALRLSTKDFKKKGKGLIPVTARGKREFKYLKKWF